MTEMEDRDAQMDRFLTRSMKAPLPALSSKFERRVLRDVNRSSELVHRYRWMFFLAYTVVSAFTSLLLMHNAGIAWLPILAILAPVVLVPAAVSAVKTRRAAIQSSET